MRIAYCIPGLHLPGGMERVLTLKANFLASQGYEVHVILTDGAGKNLAFPMDKAVQVHQLGIDLELYAHPFLQRIWLYYWRMKRFKKKLNECLCQIRPDITVSLARRDINFISRMRDGSIKMAETHVDRLHYRNFSHPSWLPNSVYSYIQHRWMQRFITEVNKLSKFVVLTYEDAAYWPEIHEVTVIPNPVSFLPEKLSECTCKQVIAAGRYVEQKGFDRLIAAWKQVVEKHPDWVLKIYGDGFLREQLTAQVAALGLQQSCYLEHTTPDIVSKFQESSIFVLSSRFEGLPMVILEAMACGLPVVAYTCPCGPRDIISEGEDGLLIEEGNIDGLADGICRLIEDEELRRAMGKNARVKAEKYTIAHIGKQWMDLFESLMERKL